MKPNSFFVGDFGPANLSDCTTKPEEFMDRRTFFRQSLGFSALAGSYLAFGRSKDLFASAPLRMVPAPVDLVAVRGGEPDAMFQKGIEAMGGIGAFVKKGQKVVLKPNIGWDVLPERGGNTNPKLVAEIIKQCLQAGAKEVYVFDHTCDEWQRCYKNSGIEAAVKNAGGKIAPAHTESYYHEISIPNGKVLKQAKEHELVLDADVFVDRFSGIGGMALRVDRDAAADESVLADRHLADGTRFEPALGIVLDQ